MIFDAPAGRNEDRAPRLTPEQWANLWREFDRLEHLDAEVQEEILRISDQPPLIVSELRRLLTASRSEGLLDKPLLDAAQESIAPSLSAGTRIGQFLVLSLLGRGGGGEVYLAERAEGGFAQRVAVKLLRPEAAGRVASFDAERALVASLEHPGIARLIDGGTAMDGRPYMVLEYVEGTNIVAWCAEHRSALNERLALFIQVCDAVAYAHARLIVHRDIKPSNILVDAAGRPRLLDFGVARLISEQMSEQEASHYHLLTPDYAAPEQLTGAPITVAADIYALGILLFELLTNTRPWQVEGVRIPAMIRRLLDIDMPLASIRAAEQQRRPVPARQIAGDLDAIIAKATQRSPERRYMGITDLAQDVRRHLTLQPVSARRASTAYLADRFLRRHRWAVAATASAVGAILIGAGGVAWQGHVAAVERDNALTEAGQLKALNDATQMIFRDASDETRKRSITVRDMIDASTRRTIMTLPPDSPDAAPTIGALADIYLSMESNQDAKALLLHALRRGIGRADPLNAIHFKLKLGIILAAEGRFAEARRLLDETDRTWATDPVRFRRERVEAAGARALILRRSGQRAAAIAVLMANLTDAERAYVKDDRDLSIRYASIAQMMLDAGRMTEADAILTRADKELRQAAQPIAEGALNLERLRAELSIRQDNARQAVPVFESIIADRRRYFGPGIALAVDLLRYARLLNQLGHPAQALVMLDEAGPMAAEHLGELSTPRMQITIAKAEALVALGRLDSGARLFAGIAPGAVAAAGDQLMTARYLRARAAVELAQRQPEAAAATLSQADRMAAPLGAGRDFFARESKLLRDRIERAQNGRH